TPQKNHGELHFQLWSVTIQATTVVSLHVRVRRTYASCRSLRWQSGRLRHGVRKGWPGAFDEIRVDGDDARGDSSAPRGGAGPRVRAIPDPREFGAVPHRGGSWLRRRKEVVPALRVEGLYKIFGRRAHEAVHRLRQGATSD